MLIHSLGFFLLFSARCVCQSPYNTAKAICTSTSPSKSCAFLCLIFSLSLQNMGESCQNCLPSESLYYLSLWKCCWCLWIVSHPISDSLFPISHFRSAGVAYGLSYLLSLSLQLSNRGSAGGACGLSLLLSLSNFLTVEVPVVPVVCLSSPSLSPTS